MKYVDHDGSVHMIVCHCGLEADWTQWEDGARTLYCPNGHRLGLQLDMGELDLGIVREAVEDSSDFVIYGETPVIDQ